MKKFNLREVNTIYLYLIIVILAILSITMSTLFITKKRVVTKTVTLISKEEKKEVINKIKVDIKGNVANPGVIELDEGSRVIDAIKLAGGLLDNSNTELINLSMKLKDEMTIIIYTNKEINDYKKNLNKKEIVYVELPICPDKINDACINKDTKNSSKKDIQNEKVSINTATIDELQKIPGIGASKANDIISYREKNGSFNTIEDIKQVSGIGDALFEKIKDNITI
ncbi:MAG: helix-hairpin-helix domain-containing protein [Bacilli bacterium]|nr:helix-hairpin-helix domain-containing protein [Bacilli bacterium]